MHHIAELNDIKQYSSLYRLLRETSSSFPVEFAAHRILPSLISALEFGGASAATIVPLMLQLGKELPDNDYSKLRVLWHLSSVWASTKAGVLDSL